MNLKKLEEKASNCTKCPLHKNRNQVVFGEGPKDANIFLIGEGPGAREDKTGRPFIGRSGQLLSELINSIGLKRNQIYITSVVKCRPLKNRNPRSPEIKKCVNIYLDKQIAIINPEIIVPMGLVAMKYVFGKYGLELKPIGEIHGKVYQQRNRKIMPLYHPAAGLYNPNLKPVMRKDWKKLKRLKGVVQ